MSKIKLGFDFYGDNFSKCNSLFFFSAYDIALLYNCKLLKSSINKLCNCSFDYIEIIKKVLRDFVKEPYIIDSIIFNCDDDFFRTCIRGSYFGYKDKAGNIKSDRIFFGFSPELLGRDIVYKKNSVENYLYGIAVKKDVINMQLLYNNDIDYCEDISEWIYFPIDNVSLESDDFSLRGTSSVKLYSYNSSCVSTSFDLERNLDICHSLITLHKMEVLISESGQKIVDKLNQENLGVEFKLGSNYNYVFPDSSKKIYCGNFIYMVGKADSIYFGIAPNVFDEEDEVKGEAGILKTRNPSNVIVSDYFSSVSMVIMNSAGMESSSRTPFGTLGALGKEKYINNGVEFAGNWVYFPICRKLLCCNNFEELYVNRVVKLIREGYIKYFR